MGKNELKLEVEKEKTKQSRWDAVKWKEINKFGIILGGVFLILGIVTYMIVWG